MSMNMKPSDFLPTSTLPASGSFYGQDFFFPKEKKTFSQGKQVWRTVQDMNHIEKWSGMTMTQVVKLQNSAERPAVKKLILR